MKKKVFYILLSVVVSFGLWLYVTTVVSPESKATIRGVKVELINQDALHDKRLMVTTEKLPTVSLELVGNRSDLNKLNPSNITLIADLSKIYSAGEQDLYYSVVFPSDVPSNAIAVENQSPASIKVTVVERDRKEVPVEVEYSGKVPDGFLTDRENLTLDKEVVTVAGPATVIEKIHHAKITVNLEGQRETINQNYSYVLCDAEGNVIDEKHLEKEDGEEINLNLKIQRVKEINLAVTVIPGGGATEETAEITMSHTSIQVSGSEHLLDELEDTIIIGELKLAEFTGDADKVFTFKLPDGVTNLSMPNNEVIVSVKFPGLQTKTLSVTNIRTRNVPLTLNVETVTKELTVTIRGTEEQLALLTEENVIVYVDLTNAEVGTTATYQAVIYVDVEGCGAVGTYLIYAKVTEK